MRILVATTNGASSHNQVIQFLKSNRGWHGSKISLLAIVEPSPVLDVALSAAGRTRFRQILDERVAFAQADLTKLSVEIRQLLPVDEDVETNTVVGEASDVALKAAHSTQADLMVISAEQSGDITPKSMMRLVSQSPCSVAFVKTAS
jgi:nucleotide-binding universal stress UspA family protein